MRQFFIGVDGGATKTIVRVHDETGACIGEESAGPANIRISVQESWQSILCAFNKILLTQNIDVQNKNFAFHAGIGIAGCELPLAYQQFLNFPHPFHTLLVTSDAHIACLGAHGGQDGAIIIAGTGVVGFQIENGQTSKVGGFGFPHDDQGGGAWLGLYAMKKTLQWLDKRKAGSLLTEKIVAHFDHDISQMVTWANTTNSTGFATLAPFVIECAQKGDAAAVQLLQQAACALDEVSEALLAHQSSPQNMLPCALIGGLSAHLEPYLGSRLRSRLQKSKASPVMGAIHMVRNGLMR